MRQIQLLQISPEELQSEIDDPWPRDTAHFTYHVPHAESRREAKPIFIPQIV